MGKLKLYRLKEEYGMYLKQYDYRVPDIIGSKNNRKFVGVVLEIEDIKYYAPISSPKAKHKILHNSNDFQKIENGKYGAINLNNMIPVPREMVEYIDIPNMPVPTEEDAKYKNLLFNQYKWCQKNSNILQNKAKRLHYVITHNLNEQLAKRCCDFPLLERKCKEYERNLYFEKQVKKPKGSLLEKAPKERAFFNLKEKDEKER